MNCPECGSPSVYVKDTIPSNDERIFRRRKCFDCGINFRTVEIVDDGTEDFKRGYNKAWLKKHPRLRQN